MFETSSLDIFNIVEFICKFISKISNDLIKVLAIRYQSVFRAPQWEIAIIAKIFMAIFRAYLFLSVMAMGVRAYYILHKEFPNEPNIDFINKGVFFVVLIKAILRYFSKPPQQPSSVLDFVAHKKTFDHQQSDVPI
ncbi:MAG: hypothetical protein CMC93_04745, partial [Flavobacteriaceae bacterium]|nr:hypothetical protein [Flavobacteriaceae bacterium]